MYEVHFRCSVCGDSFHVLTRNQFLDRASCPAGHVFTVRIWTFEVTRRLAPPRIRVSR